MGMSIRFYCTCGKHLKAREAMAGRRSICPACGSPVGIPSLAPTQRGTAAAPMTQQGKADRLAGRFLEPDDLAENQRRREEAGSAVSSGQPREARPRGIRRARQRRSWNLEHRWYLCLLFPLRARPLVLGLGFLLAMALALPAVLAANENTPISSTGPWWLLSISVAVYGGAFLQCALVSGAGGETSCIRWPGASLLLIVRSFWTWMICFLSGPVVFVIAAYLFWLHGGDPAWIDLMVLALLAMAGGSYWLLTLVAVHQGDRWFDANPARVADVIRRLGIGATLATYVAGLVGLVHVYLVATAIEQLHNSYFLGGMFLVATTTSALFLATFFFRLLGVWCFASRVDAG